MSAARRERIQAEAARLLAAGVTGRVFPGASACIAWSENGQSMLADAASGRLMDAGPAADVNTLYDLASITKPVVATAALRLVAAGKIALDARADSVVSDVRGGVGGQATLEKLLSHRGGLSPWGGLYLDVPHEVGSGAARRWIVSEASRRADETHAKGAVYSDLGYLIAGEMIARAYGGTLDKVIAQEVTQPIGIADEVFFMGALPADRRSHLSKRSAPTESCEWRGRVIRGEVHDENAAALGGVAGNAGMFGIARGVAKFGLAMLDVLAGRSTFLPKELLVSALAERPGGSYRVGWDGKSGENSSAGRRLSARSFGHLGFTGTSIWCDPDRDLVVVLLSNRVHPSRANEKIRGFRPAFHDAVVAAFDS